MLTARARAAHLGIFAGTGVGKSVLMGMIARYTAADVIVIALIGERGREVNEFIEKDLGAGGLAKTRGGGEHVATSRRCCACGRRSRPRRSPSTSATRARTCCC